MITILGKRVEIVQGRHQGIFGVLVDGHIESMLIVEVNEEFEDRPFVLSGTAYFPTKKVITVDVTDIDIIK